MICVFVWPSCNICLEIQNAGSGFSFRFDLNLFCYFQFVCANLLYLQLILVSHFLSVDFSGSNQISTQPHHLINVFWKSLYLVLDHLYIYVLSIDILVNPIVHGTYISCNIYCTHLVMCSENEMLVHLDWKNTLCVWYYHWKRTNWLISRGMMRNNSIYLNENH